MKTMWSLCRIFKISIVCLSIIVGVVLAKHHSSSENPSNEIVDIINTNRTASKLPKLYNSPGLGCMALQYISECTSNCSSNNTLICHPSEVDITEVYAPNCGVELPTVSNISGHLVGCRWDYITPDQAFSDVLFYKKEGTSLLHEKELTEVGVGFSRAHSGAYFWCVLFSSGKTKSSFVLEGGSGIEQRTGCFSGTDQPCSAASNTFFMVDLTPAVISMLIYIVIGILFD